MPLSGPVTKEHTVHYDEIVIGVGGIGSATVYELARRGRRVLGLERFDIPHEMGSSHGHTRIIRLAYYEHPSYVHLLRRAYELWREIQSLAGEQLLHITGSIDAGPEDGWVFKGSYQSCLEHNLAHEVLTGTELARRFPGYQLPATHYALLQPEGGFLTPEHCISAYVMAAQALGAEVHAREQVLGWEPLGEGVRVTTTRGVYEAGNLVITAGAWNAGLLGELGATMVPERQVLAWLQPSQPAIFAPARFPVFNLEVDEGRYYGFPVFRVPGFKFGRYRHLGEVVDPDTIDRTPNQADEDILRQFAARYFPEGAGATMALRACMFTNTPDGHFTIDRHPTYPQVLFTSPCSGHGYKFASVLGEIMAELATQGQTRHDIAMFRHDRFAVAG